MLNLGYYWVKIHDEDCVFTKKCNAHCKPEIMYWDNEYWLRIAKAGFYRKNDLRFERISTRIDYKKPAEKNID